MTKQCPSCGGICKPSGCELENVTKTWMNSRKWQGLTEVEKVNVAIECGCADVAWMDFADAIEAKLKAKNSWLTN